VADYLPAPHGLPGFAVPVERDVPALVPYLELADGTTIVATDGADEIHPSADGRELRAVWRRWAQLGTRSGTLVDPGLVSDVRWTVRDGALTRAETLTATAPIMIRSWRLVVPTTASTYAMTDDGVALAAMRVSISTPWKSDTQVRATGNDAIGRGARGHVPLHVMYEAHDLSVTPGRPVTWQVTIRPQRSNREHAEP
jgi:hypothetical protein